MWYQVRNDPSKMVSQSMTDLIHVYNLELHISIHVFVIVLLVECEKNGDGIWQSVAVKFISL